MTTALAELHREWYRERHIGNAPRPALGYRQPPLCIEPDSPRYALHVRLVRDNDTRAGELCFLKRWFAHQPGCKFLD